MSGPLNRTVMWLTGRQLFAKRRLWLAAAFALAPVLFTLVFRVFVDDGPASETTFFNNLIREIVIGTLLPLAALVFGTTAFGGEMDDGTLIYLLTKPIPRWQVLSSKFVVAILSTVAVALPAILLSWFALSAPEVSGRAVTAYIAGAAMGALFYCALFVMLGITSKRAVVIGLLYVISIEGIASRAFAGIKYFSVREYALAFAQTASAKSLTIDGALSTMVATRMGLVMFACTIGWTAYRLVRYEVAERT